MLQKVKPLLALTIIATLVGCTPNKAAATAPPEPAFDTEQKGVSKEFDEREQCMEKCWALGSYEFHSFRYRSGKKRCVCVKTERPLVEAK